jgi:hypothetical protein
LENSKITHFSSLDSLASFKHNLTPNLPPQELKSTSRPDILYQLLQCLQVLVLNAQALADHRGFLIWCQENLLIDK